MKSFQFLFVFTLSLGFAASNLCVAAKTSESRLVLEKLKQKKFEEVKEVTDAELRAMAGSQSKWSLSGGLSYYGPSIDRLDSEIKPNPENTAMETRTSGSASLSARYRYSSKTSISIDSGVSFYTPLSGATDGEVDDPGITLSKLYSPFGLQMRSRYSASVTTNAYYRDRGQIGRLNMSHDFKKKLGGPESPLLWSVGSSFNYFAFERSFSRGDGRVSNYLFSVYPGLQYDVTSDFNLGTSLAFGYSNLREEENWWNWDRRLWSQRLTIGYALTRNAYFKPYFNFFPERFTWDTTSVNLNLYLNLF